MNKQEVVSGIQEFLKASGLKMEDIALGYGGCAVMMGIREQTSDIDLDVPEDYFNRLPIVGFEKKVALTGELISVRPNVDVHAAVLGKDCIYIEGIRCYNAYSALQAKIFMLEHPKRKPEKIEQDKKDIAALKRLIQEGLFVS